MGYSHNNKKLSSNQCTARSTQVSFVQENNMRIRRRIHADEVEMGEEHGKYLLGVRGKEREKERKGEGGRK